MRPYLLTDEPWIPCERPGGARIDLGLREVFRQAHQLGALSDPSPLVTGSLVRLLLAVVHRCLGPATYDDWIALYQSGRFDAAIIDAYFDRWQARFDLFAPDRPFYQTPGLPYNAFSAAQLIAERSNYGAPLQLFEHRPSRASGSLGPAEAARALVAAQAFRPGGLVSRGPGEPSSAAAAPFNAAALIIIRGKTLFETLLLNTLLYDPAQNLPIAAVGASDEPAWEQAAPPAPGTRPPSGWLDVLTWQSRRIELRPSADGERVDEYVLAGGWSMGSETGCDPMVAYRRHDKLGLRALRIEEDRAVWRDAHAFMRAADADHATIRPRTIEQLCSPDIFSVVPPHSRYMLDVLGMRGDQAKIKLTRIESLPVSPELLADVDRGELIREAVALAESIASVLRQALFTAARFILSTGSRPPASEDISHLIDASGGVRELWSRLRMPFLRLLGNLAECDDSAIDSAIDHYRSELGPLAKDVLSQAITSFGDTARVMKGQAIAEAYFARELAKLLSNQPTGKETP